jgi:hypothetical protein
MDFAVRVKIKGPLLSGKGPEIIQRQQEAAITEMVMYLLPKIQALTPQGVFGAQGGLLASIQADFQGKGTPAFKGILATDSKYGDVIDKGRRAGKGMPPKGSLVRWIELKFGLDEKSAQRIEYVVRHKIGQKGFEGVHMFEKGLADSMAMLQSIAARYGLETVKELRGE